MSSGHPGSVRPDTGTDHLERARAFAREAGLGDPPASSWTPLTGGVSSDLWAVDLGDRTVCVKGALEKLRVADEWHAPLSRNAVEFAWLTFAGRECPSNVPAVLAHSADAGFFAMEYLDPATHPVWKTQLLAGDVRRDTAAAVGEVLGRLHDASTRDPSTRATFATDDNFRQLRLEPYFETTARRNAVVAPQLRQLEARTARTHLAVVHGDFSPKNILVGAGGPVLLDAECAWFGDPAFDVAFCITHLILKTVVRPDSADALLDGARALLAAYLDHVSWEESDALVRRTATLVPALLLARVDGSSPVEYITAPAARAAVRSTAITLLQQPSTSVGGVLDRVSGAFVLPVTDTAILRRRTNAVDASSRAS